MLDAGRRELLGVRISVIDYEAAVRDAVAAAKEARPFAMTALAVHGVMEAFKSDTLRAEINSLDVVTPDGQPVRWALNLLHGVALQDRVAGPELMLWLLKAFEEAELPVYFYGSQVPVLQAVAGRLSADFPDLVLAGSEPSQFREVAIDELDEIATRIRASGARLVFVGLGCPRQEQFAAAIRDLLGVPVFAVGAGFDFFAGNHSRPPALVQRAGLEWVWRLASEPRRLWRRYLFLNPYFLYLVGRQRFRRDVSGPTDLPGVQRPSIPA